MNQTQRLLFHEYVFKTIKETFNISRRHAKPLRKISFGVKLAWNYSSIFMINHQAFTVTYLAFRSQLDNAISESDHSLEFCHKLLHCWDRLDRLCWKMNFTLRQSLWTMRDLWLCECNVGLGTFIVWSWAWNMSHNTFQTFGCKCTSLRLQWTHNFQGLKVFKNA